MKLYATVTSERASKGQGGNEYLSIHIRKAGDRDNDAMVITAYPDGDIVINHDEDVRVLTSTFKGEKEEGDTKAQQAYESGKCDMHGVRDCVHCHDWE